MSEDKFTQGLDAQTKLRALEVFGKGTGFGGHYDRLPSGYRERLSKAIKAEAIRTHPSKSYLSTIKAIYITERLNSVFGILGWDFESEIIDTIDAGKDKKGDDLVHVVSRGRIYFREFDLYSPIQYGGHEGKKSELGDVYKSAITDCQGKCASLIEIGIQVFKGNPDSKEGNKSTRLDKDAPKPTPAPPAEPIENPKGMDKPSYEPIDEPEASIEKEKEKMEMEMLRDKHVKLFGKKANANISLKKLQMKIAEEEEKIAENAKKAEEQESGSPELPVEEPTPSPIQPNMDFEPIEEQADPFEPIEEEPVEEVESVTILDAYKAKVDEYVDAASLRDEAKKIVYEAKMEGASDEDIEELKKYCQATYNELKND